MIDANCVLTSAHTLHFLIFGTLHCSNQTNMVFCSNCGTQVPDAARFCPECGTQASSAASSSGGVFTGDTHTSEELTGVTSAVRSYAANASAEEKEKKYGQQKWGLFETNYQRNKGISTEQSLQEIEEFASTGVTVGHGLDTVGSSSGAGGAGGFGSAGGAGGFGSAGGAGFSSGGSAGFSSGGSSSSPSGKPGAVGFGKTNFAPRGDSGAQYFMQHQQREAAKYKPGYTGSLQ